MVHSRISVLGALLLGAGSAIGFTELGLGGGTSRPIDLSDTPPEVQQTFSRVAQGRTPTNVVLRTESGITSYQIQYDSERGPAAMRLAGNGEIIRAHTVVGERGLPESVRGVLAERFPDALYEDAEAILLGYYEVDLEVDGESLEVIVLANGEIESVINESDEEGEDDDGEDDDGEDDDGEDDDGEDDDGEDDDGEDDDGEDDDGEDDDGEDDDGEDDDGEDDDGEDDGGEDDDGEDDDGEDDGGVDD